MWSTASPSSGWFTGPSRSNPGSIRTRKSPASCPSWDQRGSKVTLGTLLVIPIEEALIYVQPLYIKAETGQIPELKRVVVAYENLIAMEETLDKALARIFGQEPRKPREAPAAPGMEAKPEGLKPLSDLAWQDLQKARQSLAGGKLDGLRPVIARSGTGVEADAGRQEVKGRPG